MRQADFTTVSKKNNQLTGLFALTVYSDYMADTITELRIND